MADTRSTQCDISNLLQALTDSYIIWHIVHGVNLQHNSWFTRLSYTYCWIVVHNFGSIVYQLHCMCICRVCYILDCNQSDTLPLHKITNIQFRRTHNRFALVAIVITCSLFTIAELCIFQWMVAGQNGHSGAKLVQLVAVVLRQGTALALIHHRYMVVSTVVGSQKKQRTAIHLPVQVTDNSN